MPDRKKCEVSGVWGKEKHISKQNQNVANDHILSKIRSSDSLQTIHPNRTKLSGEPSAELHGWVNPGQEFSQHEKNDHVQQ